jgi:hypothetical protein
MVVRFHGWSLHEPFHRFGYDVYHRPLESTGQAPNCRNLLKAVPNPSPQIQILHINRKITQLTGSQSNKVSIRLSKPRPDHAGLSSSITQRYTILLYGISKEKTINSNRPSKSCAALAPNMQFYFYRVDRKVIGTKWSRALALLLCNEEWGLLESLVLEVLEERL